LKIAFFGLPLGALALLADGHRLLLAALSPVAAPGRRRLARRLAREALVDALEGSLDATEGRVDTLFSRESPDLLVCWFWTRLLPARWIGQPGLGAVGLHPSLLPRHRGPDPYFWTIDRGDREAGVTVYRMTPTYDTGPILEQLAIPVGGCTAFELARRLDAPGLTALRRVVRQLAAGLPLEARPQDERQATWAPRPTESDLRVDWTWSTSRVLRRIRALSPVPGLALDVEGVRMVVTRAKREPDFLRALEPGEAAIGRQVTVRTGDGAIALTRAVVGTDLGHAEERQLDGAELAHFVRGGCKVLDC
jgi:methionyl-tRNA formyltransferase